MPAKLKLNQDMIKKAADWARKGNFDVAIFNAIGVHEGTWYRWMREGEAADKLRIEKPRAKLTQGQAMMRKLYKAITRARADAEQHAVEHWIKAFPQDWRACKDYLICRFPRRWKPVDKRELSGPDGGPIETKEHQGEAVKKILMKGGRGLDEALAEAEDAFSPDKDKPKKKRRTNGTDRSHGHGTT